MRNLSLSFASLGLLLHLLACTNAQQPELINDAVNLDIQRTAEMIDRRTDFSLDVPERYRFLYAEKEFDEEKVRQLLPFTEIRLAKSTCLLCVNSTFELVLEANGKVTLLKRNEVRLGKLSVSSYAKLCLAIERMGLLDDKRHGDPLSHDGQTTAIQIKSRDGEKTVVSDYGHAYKIEFTLLVSLIEHLAFSTDRNNFARIEWDAESKTGDNQAVNPSRR